MTQHTDAIVAVESGTPLVRAGGARWRAVALIGLAVLVSPTFADTPRQTLTEIEELTLDKTYGRYDSSATQVWCRTRRFEPLAQMCLATGLKESCVEKVVEFLIGAGNDLEAVEYFKSFHPKLGRQAGRLVRATHTARQLRSDIDLAITERDWPTLRRLVRERRASSESRKRAIIELGQHDLGASRTVLTQLLFDGKLDTVGMRELHTAIVRSLFMSNQRWARDAVANSMLRGAVRTDLTLDAVLTSGPDNRQFFMGVAARADNAVRSRIVLKLAKPRSPGDKGD